MPFDLERDSRPLSECPEYRAWLKRRGVIEIPAAPTDGELKPVQIPVESPKK